MKKTIPFALALVLIIVGIVATSAVLNSDSETTVTTESSEDTFIAVSPSEIITTAEPETEESIMTSETQTVTETVTKKETETTTASETETEPVITETEPVITEPVVTEPVVTEPVATEPVVTEPVVTEPVVTEPVVPQPSVDDVIANYNSTLPEYDPNVIPALQIRTDIDPSKPMIALTFDDGPSGHTQRLLDIFDRCGGKGTFFLVGNSIYGNAATLQRMAGAGHEIGVHTMSHPQLSLLSDKTVVDEIMMTRQLIYSATGRDVRIVRPPYGAYNANTLAVGAKLGVCFFNWSIDTLDWQTRSADATYNAIINNAYSGAIVLCHDLHGTTVDAMERVIPKLIEQGYQLVTVSELMYYSAYTVSPGNIYFRQ